MTDRLKPFVGPSLFLAVQFILCPYIPGESMDAWRELVLVVFGLAGFAYVYLCRGLGLKDLVYAPLFLSVLLWSILFNVPGYSFYQALPYYGSLGLIVLVSRLDWKWCAWALIIGAAVQALLYVKGGIVWQNVTGGDCGSVRNPIRFGAIMYSGLIAIAYLATRKVYWTLALVPVFLYMVSADLNKGYDISHAVIAVIALSAVVIAGLSFRKNKLAGVAVFVVCAVPVGYVISKYGQGFHLDTSRLDLWKETWAASNFLGHGIGSWNLLINQGHPHNFLVKMLYEFGAIGVISFLVLTGLAIWTGIKSWNYMPMVGMAGVLLIACTNDLFNYYDATLMWALMAGGALCKE